MDRIVLKRVIGRYHKSIQKRPGILNDFKRLKVKEAHYPAIVDSKGDKVEGLVVYGIANDALLLLDQFEDDEYQRKDVAVLVRGGEETTAATYVAGPNMSIEDEEWCFSTWQRNYRKEFLENLAIWNRIEKGQRDAI